MKKVFVILATTLMLTASPAGAAGLRKGYAFCRDRQSLTRLLEASVRKDSRGFSRILRSACKTARGHEKVRLIKRNGDVAQIRFGRQRRTWWTVAEAMR